MFDGPSRQIQSIVLYSLDIQHTFHPFHVYKKVETLHNRQLLHFPFLLSTFTMMLLPTAAIICSVVTTQLVNAFEMRVESMKPAQDSGDTKQHCLVFEDHFNRLDLSKWQHEITMSGGTFCPFVTSQCYSYAIYRWQLGIRVVCRMYTHHASAFY